MTDRAQMVEWARQTGAGRGKIQAKFGVGSKIAQGIAKEARMGGGKTPATAPTKAPAKKTDRDEMFRQAYSTASQVPAAVRDAIANWLALDNVRWATDDDMRVRCGVKDKSSWNKWARESPEFADYRLKHSGKVIWCKTKAYKDARHREVIR